MKFYLSRIRVVAMLLTVCISLLIVPCNSYAAILGFLIDSTTTNPGSTVSIPVRLSSVPASGLDNVELKISYYKSAITVNSITAGSIVTNNSVNFESSIDTTNGAITILFADQTCGTQPITQDGIFAIINLTVNSTASPGNYVLNIGEESIAADTSLTSLQYYTQQGIITVNSSSGTTSSTTYIQPQKTSTTSNTSMTSVTTMATSSSSTFKGDLTGEGTINSTDLSIIKRIILGTAVTIPVQNYMWAADVSGDGTVNSIDYVLEKRYLLGIITSFPSTGSTVNIGLQVKTVWVPQSTNAISAAKWNFGSYPNIMCYDYNSAYAPYSGWPSIDYTNSTGKASGDDKVLRQAEVQATVTDSNGNPKSGVALVLSSSLGSNGYVKNFLSSTDSNGHATGYIEFYGEQTFNIIATSGSYSGLLSYYNATSAKYKNEFLITGYNFASYNKSGSWSKFSSDVQLEGSGYYEPTGTWYQWVNGSCTAVTAPVTSTGTTPTVGRTIAVDSPIITRKQYFSGDQYNRGRVYIHGMVSANDDGWRTAEDSGGAINGYHIDIFTGFQDFDSAEFRNSHPVSFSSEIGYYGNSSGVYHDAEHGLLYMKTLKGVLQ